MNQFADLCTLLFAEKCTFLFTKKCTLLFSDYNLTGYVEYFDGIPSKIDSARFI